MHYYPFHVGDYRARTRHLTDSEDLAYRRLLDEYYLAEGPLPEDIGRVARLVQMPAEVVETVLREFFELREEGWRNARADVELEKYQTMRSAGARGAAKRWGGHAPPIATLHAPPMAPPLPSPIATKNQEPRTKNQRKTIVRPENVSEEAWEGYQAIRRARDSPITNVVISGLEREAERAGLSLDDVMRICAQRGWQGFKAEWVAVNGKQGALEARNRRTLDTWVGNGTKR